MMNESTPAPGVAECDDFVDWILNESLELDDLELLTHLKPLMAPVLFESICDKLERCPIHIRDGEICEDDRDEGCPIGRAAIAADRTDTLGEG